MEPFTTAIAAEVAETAKEIYDAAKDIKRTYDVSKQMKTVAESEGKEQLSAISRVSTSVAKDIETGDLNSNEKSTLTKDVQVFSEPPVESNFPSKMSGEVFFDEMPQLEGKGETLPTLSGDVFYEKEPGQLELNDPFETRTISEDRMHEQPQKVETIVREQIKDKLPSKEDLDRMMDSGEEITLGELREQRPDIADYIDNMKNRLGNNDYAQSISIYQTKEEEFIIIGHDERTNELSNYVHIKDKDVYCWAGNAKGDGHLNEFANNTDGMLPNSKYHFENVVYDTDDKGRVSDIYEHHAPERQTDRNEGRGNLKPISDAKDGRSTDVGGHFVAHNVDGPTEAINIVPMDEQFNNGKEWKSMENEICEAYQNDKVSFVHKHIEYSDESQRPSHIDVDYKIAGEEVKHRSYDLP